MRYIARSFKSGGAEFEFSKAQLHQKAGVEFSRGIEEEDNMAICRRYDVIKQEMKYQGSAVAGGPAILPLFESICFAFFGIIAQTLASEYVEKQTITAAVSVVIVEQLSNWS